MSKSSQKSSVDSKLAEKKVYCALRGKTVSKNCYEVLPLGVELSQGQSLGLIIKKDTVIGVKWNSPCLGIVRTGDILYSINKEIFSEDGSKNKEILSKITQSSGTFTVQVIRFKRRPTMRPIIPRGYKPVEGYEYEWTMLYLMRGMSLGLDVRLIDGKVYVANIMPDSIASMSLLIGECIVDVEGELITSIPQLTTAMVKAMDKNGLARLLVEAPGNDMLRNMLRAKIAAAVGVPDIKDLPLPSETKPWTEKGLAALKENEPKSIYKSPQRAEKDKKDDAGTTEEKRSAHFNEKTVELSYYDDLQTSLMVKVPPPRTSTDNQPEAKIQ
ncbi:hypothetical protein RB195_019831 [Necator americanus]|uniref:PDZ domain-containing protein n=1 Tax=Necator americanus TaxID=51031 RepID=A0ABR1CH02_NECAM